LLENNIEVDQAFTSVLRRASASCNMILNSSNQHWIPVTKTWRLNERHYGALQGYNKDSAWKELGLEQELVMQMRRSYDVRPPRMEDNHPYWHGNDRRYIDLTHEKLERSRGESLKDAADRIMPFYNSVIVPTMKAGKKCLIVAHANTIRTLIKHIDNISDEDIKGMTIPTAIPMLYRLDKNMKPVDPLIELEFQYMVEPKGYVECFGIFLPFLPFLFCGLKQDPYISYNSFFLAITSVLYLLCSYSWGTSRAHGFHGVYLGDLARLQDIQRKRDRTNRDWQRIILRNIGKSLGWDMETMPDGSLGSCKTKATCPTDPSNVVDTRQLWWLVHTKLQSSPDYTNMLLLVRMEEALERIMHVQRRKYTTKFAYEGLINKIHLDTEGCVVEPFVDLACRTLRTEREKVWSDVLALEMEEECLIR
jgi:2,3-bisphosphoglycerate-dependent phosphoglycerate mutase